MLPQVNCWDFKGVKFMNDYNRKSPHNKVQNRPKLDKKETTILLSLFENRTHRQLASLYYAEGYSVEKCAEIMCFSKRQMERIKGEMDRIALYSLLNMVSNSENAFKLLAIKKILIGGENNA